MTTLETAKQEIKDTFKKPAMSGLELKELKISATRNSAVRESVKRQIKEGGLDLDIVLEELIEDEAFNEALTAFLETHVPMIEGAVEDEIEEERREQEEHEYQLAHPYKSRGLSRHEF